MSLIGKSIGNYLIKSKLGEGGMGAVYLGEHPLIGKRVAVKVLLEELASKEDIVSRFFNEAKAVNDIGHNNIVDIVDFGKMKGDRGEDIVYFVMEFLDGESLSARLRRTGLSFQETLHVMVQACSALSASHAKGIVHRDLKPENLYLCPRGGDKNFVKLLDFGIAKLTGDTSQSHKTRTGLVIGTPAYMSPEQCEGKGLIDHRSDVYSLGVMMYELLTGRVPFPGEGFGEILVAHLTRQPDPPSSVNPDVTPELEAIVMHAIEKDRNRRFQTMDEFLAAVQNPAAHLQAWNPLPGYTPTGYTGTTPIVGSGPARQTGQGGGNTGQKGPITGMSPRPTTLSGAAAEVADTPARKSKAPLFAVAGVVVVLAVGGGIFALKGKGDNKPANTPPVVITPPPDKPKEAENIAVKVTTDPPGARIFRADTGGYEDGKTPITLTIKKGSPSFDIQIKLEGHKSVTKTIATEKDAALLFSLESDAPVQPVVQPVAQIDKPDKGDKPEKGDRKHRSSSDKEKGDKGDKPEKIAKPPREKKEKEGGTDDMKLLQPKF
jgi:eukaryotic-like serine/threonine-protein kinase